MINLRLYRCEAVLHTKKKTTVLVGGMKLASFKKLKSGWRYRLKYTDPFTQQQKEKSEAGFRTKPEAELAAAEFLRHLKQGFEQSDIPLVNYIRNWIDNYKKVL